MIRAFRHMFTALLWACAILGAAAEDVWRATGELNVARFLHTATLLDDGRVLVVGGHGDGWSRLDSAELYDPRTGMWTLTGSLGTARVWHTATLLNDGRVLVAGGDTSSGAPDFGRTGTAEIYDPAAGTWQPTSAMTTARCCHTASALPDGRVLVAGGYYDDTLATTEVFDPAAGAWSRAAGLNVPRYSHTATALLDGSVLVVGGSNDGDLASTLASAERYDPATGIWSAVADSARSSVYHTATRLTDGSVLVAGGYDTPPRSDVRAEHMDPESGLWSSLAPLSSARDGHAATLLPTGDVLVTGGQAWSGRMGALRIATVGESELFAAASGIWIPAAALNSPRHYHTATLLLDGRVLVAGGSATNGYAGRAALERLRSAELYGAAIELDECKNHYILMRPCPTPN
jgi:hypothetical protein